MNSISLLSKRWRKFKGEDVRISYQNGSMIVENSGNSDGFIVFPELEKFVYNDMKIEFRGEVLEGKSGTLKLLNRHRTILAEIELNSSSVLSRHWFKYYIYTILIPAKSKIKIHQIDVCDFKEFQGLYDEFFTGDVLLVAPGYPSMANKYMMGFVHTRVQAYKKLGWNIDVAAVSDYLNTSIYEFEGVKVFKTNYYHLREVLRCRKYKKILIHFFDDRYANVLDSIDMTETKLYFYLHGAETLYWDWEKIASPYFGEKAEINDVLREKFKCRDRVIKKYSQLPNVKWIFVSEWAKNRSEELVGVKYQNVDVVPCLIDTELFRYEKKDPELRKKIFVLRKFDNISTYSLDLDVRTILELSRRPYFKELEFDIYGDGDMFEKILAPLTQFSNVHMHKTFLTHEQIREMQKEHGIALIASRFDTQGVTIGEAAAAGCVTVTSDVPGIRQWFPSEVNTICEPENYVGYADVIERMYYNPEEFVYLGKVLSDSVRNQFDFAHTIQKELDIFEKEDEIPIKTYQKRVEKPVLTVIIPSYNVGKYLKHGVMSLLNHTNAHKLEILIVNDGSKDDTAEIGRYFEKLTTVDGVPIVKLVDKENGGHGSTINKGIELATGRYVKIMDGDDTVDSVEFSKLIDILEYEDADIVLNDYMKDYEQTNTTEVVYNYKFMAPGVQYHFDDLCWDGYGFGEWGPILACSSYKTEMLKKADFKISEKMFYVDMELNIHIAIACDTLKYYPLTIYRYLLGRAGQSANYDGYIRNYKHHEQVTINLINILKSKENLISEKKRNYVVDKLILPMISTQYLVVIEWFKKRNGFLEFENQLKNYPEFYNAPRITTKKVKFHRLTKGFLIRFHSFFVRINAILRKIDH